MRRLALRSLALAVIAFLPLAAVPAWAQEASPPAAEAAFELPVDLPEAPAQLAMFRVTLEPGEQIPLHPHSDLEIVFVVAGSATLRTAEGPEALGVRGRAGEAGATPEAAGPGSELTVAAGDAVIVPPGNVHEARAGNEGVTVMIFGLASQAGEGTPEA